MEIEGCPRIYRTCFLSRLKEELQSLPSWPTECCIFKVPVNLRSINDSAYTPKVVSIGPLHHGATKLQPMEAHKRRYLDILLNGNSKISLESLVQVLMDLDERARNCYEDEFTRHLNRDQFIEMMLLDGCFILTYFNLRFNDAARDRNDPMFNEGPLLKNVEKDIRLLENQLPFFILEHLYRFAFSPADSKAFLKTTFLCFERDMKNNQFQSLAALENHQVKHFVDLILKCNLPSQAGQNSTNDNADFILIRSASNLRKCGIKFKKGVGDNILDIKYKNAVLEIPSLCISDYTEEQFRNLIAMEQCHRSSSFHITDYTRIMDSLIDTPDDVSLLQSCGIINNRLGSDEDACWLFNNITKGVYRDLEKSHYIGIVKDVNAHCNRRWNLRMTHLRRDYFNSPWTIISLIAALFLLICTIVQAVCSVISVT